MLGPAGHALAAPRLAALADAVAGPLRAAHRDAEAHPPILVQFDAWGRRVDRIETSRGWEDQRRAAATYGVVAITHLPDARESFRAGTRVVQHALLHLYGPESATFSCPVAMTDGAATLLSRPDVDPDLRAAWLPRLTATDPNTAITSGQWMTEAEGGSDISRSSSTASRDATGGWRITGEKGFCSRLGYRHRPCPPRRCRPGQPGARPVPRPPLRRRRRPGRRCLVAGGRLDGNPLHRATLGTLAVSARAAFALAVHAFGLLGRVEVDGDETADAELRLVAPLAKLLTGRLAVASAGEYVECFGGAGYVGNSGVPRLLRDAQVLPIWEGTTNMLSLDVLRALSRGEGLEPLLDRLAAGVALADGALSDGALSAGMPAGDGEAGLFAGYLADLREQVGDAAKEPGGDRVQAGARGLAVRLGNALGAALLMEHAAWARTAGTDPGAVPAARLWIRERLAGQDVADAAHRYAEIL